MDSGEEAINALKREFLEETMNSEEATDDQKQEMEEKCQRLFQNGVEVRRLDTKEMALFPDFIILVGAQRGFLCTRNRVGLDPQFLGYFEGVARTQFEENNWGNLFSA